MKFLPAPPQARQPNSPQPRPATTTLGPLLTLVLSLCFLPGCTTRSISDSGYRSGYGGRNPFYSGELREFDVLGLDTAEPITEAQIQERLSQHQPVRVPRGSRVLLVQSGAFLPDATLIAAVNQHYTAVPFSGQPARTNSPSFALALRLAAAQAGCGSILCVWGALESAVQQHQTKAISWVPVVGGAFPDETQHMRLRLKLIVVDTRTGHWVTRAPEPVTSKALSAKLDRESTDQSQVERLKQRGYEFALSALATDLAP